MKIEELRHLASLDPEEEGITALEYHEIYEYRQRYQDHCLNTHQMLLDALRKLEDAADVFCADQSGAEDRRCGLVQPVTVEEAESLNDAVRNARNAIKAAEEVKDA